MIKEKKNTAIINFFIRSNIKIQQQHYDKEMKYIQFSVDLGDHLFSLLNLKAYIRSIIITLIEFLFERTEKYKMKTLIQVYAQKCIKSCPLWKKIKKMSDFTLQVSDFTLRALVWFEVKFQTFG